MSSRRPQPRSPRPTSTQQLILPAIPSRSLSNKQIETRTKVLSLFAKISKESSKTHSLHHEIIETKLKLIKEICELMNIRERQRNITFNKKEVENLSTKICDFPVKTAEISAQIRKYDVIVQHLKKSVQRGDIITTKSLLQQLNEWENDSKKCLSLDTLSQERYGLKNMLLSRSEEDIKKTAPFTKRATNDVVLIKQGMDFVSIIESIFKK